MPMKQAQGVAQFMNCSVMEALKLATDNGALYDEVAIYVRAESLADHIMQKGR